MKPLPDTTCTAFAGHRLVASGPLRDVARACKDVLDAGAPAPLVFDDRSGRQLEIDFRGTPKQVLARLRTPATAPKTATARGPGRPKLGVLAREVTLLPRHWDWLGEQPGGASATLRRLVEDARRGNGPRDRARRSAEALERFMLAMAGDLPGYEEATRCFYRADRAGFDARTAKWPEDVRAHARRLAAVAWDDRVSAEVQRGDSFSPREKVARSAG
jgi:hypothetical protein